MNATKRSTAAAVTRRPARSGDDRFLQHLYRVNHIEPFHQAGLPSEMCNQLLATQYETRRRQYSSQYPRADDQIVEVESEPIGRLLVDYQPDRVLIVDIAITPECQRFGLGTRLIEGVIASASTTKSPIELTVASDNSAISFYRKLQFVPMVTTEMYISMRRSTTEGPVS